jgi:hypothetical protein
MGRWIRKKFEGRGFGRLIVVLYRHVHGGTDENHENLNQDSRGMTTYVIKKLSTCSFGNSFRLTSIFGAGVVMSYGSVNSFVKRSTLELCRRHLPPPPPPVPAMFNSCPHSSSSVFLTADFCAPVQWRQISKDVTDTAVFAYFKYGVTLYTDILIPLFVWYKLSHLCVALNNGCILVRGRVSNYVTNANRFSVWITR